jgi:hypothetical protein
VVIQHTEVELRIRVPLDVCLLVPLPGLPIVLRHAKAVVIQHPEVGLRVCQPLCRSLFVPLPGLPIVLRNTLTSFIKHPKVGLRFCAPLGCRSFVPQPRKGIILGSAQALVIHHTEVVLGGCISLLGQRSPLAQGCHVVAAIIGIQARLKIGPGGRGKTDDRQHEGDGESEREGHGSLAGRRILGGGYLRVQEAGVDNAPDSHRGWYDSRGRPFKSVVRSILIISYHIPLHPLKVS